MEQRNEGVESEGASLEEKEAADLDRGIILSYKFSLKELQAAIEHPVCAGWGGGLPGR